MRQITVILSFTIFTLLSCINPADKKKVKDLECKVVILDSIKNELLIENEELKKSLTKYEDEKSKTLNEENVRLEKLKETSQGLILNNKVQVVKVVTGFDPYHNQDNLWLPSIALMFNNISESDINDFIKVRAVFIDNSSGEQIAEDYEYLCTNSRPLTKGVKKQITLHSSFGWYAVQNQNVSVKISIEDEPFKTFKINNTEFSGRI